MTAKRLDVRAGFLALGLFLGVPTAGVAQLSNGQWHLPAGSTGRATTGVQAKTQPQVVVVPGQPGGSYYGPTVFRRRPYPLSHRAQLPVPAVLMPDGSVYADFGYGYEPVYRSCHAGGARTVVVGQPAVIGSNGVVLSPAQPATYTQPVPNQQTSSQIMAGQANRQVAVSSVAQSACYNRDGTGRIFVVRF